jgi:hypothetical protein
MTGLGSWGYNYTMDQIVEQARDAVIGRIRRYEEQHKDVLRVIDVDVTAIFTPETK